MRGRGRNRGPVGAIARRLLGDERGQELVEMVVILPVLTLAVLGIMEVGHVYTVGHAMAALTREGANLAARGTVLPQVAQIVVNNGDDILLSSNGGAIASRLVIQGGVPIVAEQTTHGSVGLSKLGLVGEAAAPLAGIPFDEGRVLYAVEIFYQYAPITPLLGVGGGIIPSNLYERTLF